MLLLHILFFFQNLPSFKILLPKRLFSRLLRNPLMAVKIKHFGNSLLYHEAVPPNASRRSGSDVHIPSGVWGGAQAKVAFLGIFWAQETWLVVTILVLFVSSLAGVVDLILTATQISSSGIDDFHDSVEVVGMCLSRSATSLKDDHNN